MQKALIKLQHLLIMRIRRKQPKKETFKTINSTYTENVSLREREKNLKSL